MKVTNPYWGNEEKTQIICDFTHEDGRIESVSINHNDGENPDWDIVLDIYTAENIDLITKEFEGKGQTLAQQRVAESNDDREKQLNESLFQAKIEAFQIDEIKASKNRVLKSKIRKASSLTAVYIYSAILAGESYFDEGE
jgi:ABC-type sugar transport system ATPase subunit